MGSATMSPTVMRGFSEEYGSWNTSAAFLRKSVITGPFSILRPSNHTSPAVG